jgi:hypothetical protein
MGRVKPVEAHNIKPPGSATLLCEGFRVDSGLFEYRPQRAFRHVAGVIWNRGEPPGGWIAPNFMRTGGLAMELKPEALETPNDLPVAEPRETTHVTRSR